MANKLKDVESFDPNKINQMLDDKMCEALQRAEDLARNTEFTYTVEMLDDAINSDETLRDYLEHSAFEFGKENPMLDHLDSAQLTALVASYDEMWNNAIG